MYKFLSCFLCLMLVVSILPTSGFAEEVAAENLLSNEIMLPEAIETPAEIEFPVEEEAPVEGKTPAETEPVPVEEVTIVEVTPVTEELPLDGATSGTCGENLTWTLDDDGTLTISGTGAMDDFHHSTGAPWYYADPITRVVIEDGVTYIGSFAFKNCFTMTDISIPDSVTAIGNSAFQNCSGLTSINLPDSITDIGFSAFSECSSLKSFTIPDGVTKINNSTFFDCRSLTNITIPDSVTYIDWFAFQNCTNLTSINLSNNITYIGIGAFCACSSLTSITLPTGITSISSSTFSSCNKLKSLTMSSSIKMIEEYAFIGCSSLEHILYIGTEAQWSKLAVDEYNSTFNSILPCYGEEGDDIVCIDTCIKVGVECPVCEWSLTTNKYPPTHKYTDSFCTLCHQSSLADGTSTLDDVVLILRHTIRAITLAGNDYDLADANNDDIVDARDATQYLRDLSDLSSLVSSTGDISEEAYKAYLKAYLRNLMSDNSLITEEMYYEFAILIDAGDYVSFPMDMLFNGMLSPDVAMTYDEFVAAGGIY